MQSAARAKYSPRGTSATSSAGAWACTVTQPSISGAIDAAARPIQFGAQNIDFPLPARIRNRFTVQPAEAQAVDGVYDAARSPFEWTSASGRAISPSKRNP